MAMRHIRTPQVLGKPLLCILLVSIAWVPTCSGATPSDQHEKYHLAIDSLPLSRSLQEFARQSGVQIVFFSEIAEGLQAPSLNGQYTIATALAILLQGSRLTFRVINPKTIEILPLASAKSRNQAGDEPAAPFRNATSDRDKYARDQKQTPENPMPLEEVVVAATAEGLVATRTQTPLRQIPQTVSIISQEQIRQENDTDLADALTNAVGITAVRTDSLTQAFYSRGFEVTTFHLDGGAALNSFDNTTVPFSGSPDLGEFDHVEVLRGADALFGGNGNPGATLNLVRKLPLSTEEVMFSASAGSWNNLRIEGDITGPLALDDALRGRLDVVFSDRDYSYNTASLEKKKTFGVLEYDLSPETLMTIGGSYEWDNAVPFEGGLPLYADGGDPALPRSTSFTFYWARYYTQTREIYGQLQQWFGGSWKLKINSTSLDEAAEYGYGIFQAPIDRDTDTLESPPWIVFTARPNTQNQFVVDATLTGSFEWFGRRADVALGGDYTHVKGDLAYNVFDPSGPVSSAFAYNPGAYPDPRLTKLPDSVSESLTTSNQVGLFASLKAYLSADLSVSAGMRDSNDRTHAYTTSTYPSSPGFSSFAVSDVKNFGKVTPYGGVIFRLDQTYSLYASYADIYVSNDGLRRPDGVQLAPADGGVVEAGIKGAWRDGALNASLAAYDVDQRGLAVYDASASNLNATYQCCYLPDGHNRSKGVDTEVSGVLEPGWLIGAGYTFNINRSEFGNALSGATPRHLLKLWTSKQLRGDWSGWNVGGNLQAQSSTFEPGDYCLQAYVFGGGCSELPTTSFKDIQGSYMFVNLRVGYDFDRHWRTALSINNVFDRIYYQTVGGTSGNNWYGEPRSFLLRLDGRY
jgi:outer membrane receptor for ferric coprogen and ferric-rhodotorulic acid